VEALSVLRAAARPAVREAGVEGGFLRLAMGVLRGIDRGWSAAQARGSRFGAIVRTIEAAILIRQPDMRTLTGTGRYRASRSRDWTSAVPNVRVREWTMRERPLRTRKVLRA
jgi:hypothetical protein